jgi:hypothetical protein
MLLSTSAERVPVKRRVYLALCAGGLSGLAGCNGTREETPSPTRTPTPEPTTREGTGRRDTTREETPSSTPGTSQDAGVDLSELPSPLAVDGTNPFVYVNDIPLDNFNGELALAMASDADGVDLRGYLHEFPRPPWWDSDRKYERAKSLYVTHHRKTRELATRSGFTTLPPAELGLYDRHEKPRSGAIADTEPVGSPGTDTIVEAARSASRENPLVVAVGGPLCTVADAYLTDPSIADRVVVFWRGKPPLNDGWNGELSGWSATVALRSLRTVLCPAEGSPRITRTRVNDALPDTPLKEYILTKVYDGTGENPLAGGEKWAGDAVSILAAAHPETRQTVENLRVGGTQSHWALGPVLPSLSSVSSASALKIIRQNDHDAMNEAWWSHVGDPSTWDGE